MIESTDGLPNNRGLIDGWDNRDIQVPVSTFLKGTSLAQSITDKPIAEDMLSIINDLSEKLRDDPEATDETIYVTLREYVERISKTSKIPIKGVFDRDTWLLRAFSRSLDIFSMLPELFSPSSLLDIGSSDASIAVSLGRRYGIAPKDIHAMDIREDPQLYKLNDPGSFTFTLIKPGESLPFPDESISLVTSTMVLHHIEDPEETIAEIFRILRPGGFYVISEHDADLTNTGEEIHDFLDIVHGLYATVLSDIPEMSPREFIDEHYSNYLPMTEWIKMIESKGFFMFGNEKPSEARYPMYRQYAAFVKPREE